MLLVVGSEDRFLSENLGRIIEGVKLRCIRTNKIERIIKELKQPERIAVIDLNWETIQEVGVLKRLVNVGNISGNKVVCICPNQEDDLKKLAKRSRVADTFIRYDLELRFKDYLKML